MRSAQVFERTLQGNDAVDAAWEGGSAAFGSDDGLSDVDAVAVVADDAVESTFSGVESALHALSPVTLRYDMPGTVGFAQKFYRLRDAGEFLVRALAFVHDLDDLALKHQAAVQWFGQCIAGLQDAGPGSGLPAD